jgi:hypothetical protein
MKPPTVSVRTLAAAGLLTFVLGAYGQSQEKENLLTLDLQMMTRGEIRDGGLADEKEEIFSDKSNFVIERERLIVGYEKSWLQMKLNIQHQGIWGQSGKGSTNVYEGWAKLEAKNGLFAKVGRQTLSYDDERIIGPNDWSMAGLSHDALKLGYEGHGHKAHVILAYNQNAENVNGGTYYVKGAYPYKTMQTAWYHYDLPHVPLGASALFMNIGMQGGEKNVNERTEWQQVLGGYLKYSPKHWSVEGSYYRQMGKNEDGVKIDAWMASVKAQVSPSNIYGFEAGYDYLSGDKYFAVPPKGGLGLVKHDVIKGFNPIYGSHHKFYGAMDFFYVSTYVNGFSPGLQNAFVGGYVKPIQGLHVGLSYHYLAMSTKLPDMDKKLGHEFELTASYQIIKEVKVSAGFSYMTGTKTMERLKRASDDGNLKWGWLSLNITPRIFTTKW